MEETVENKSVWMITSGEYSDYGVVGIFSTKELAQEYKDAFDSSDYGHELFIDEEILDPGNTSFHKMGRSVYRVLMDRDGNTQEVVREENRFLTYGESNANINNWNNNICLYVLCWATDEKHAVKIANEIRVQMIANGEWKTKK